MSEEPTDDPLMRPGWGRRHDELPVDDLVAVAVVGKRADHGGGPASSGVWHTHIVLGSAGGEQVYPCAEAPARRRLQPLRAGVVAEPRLQPTDNSRSFSSTF